MTTLFTTKEQYLYFRKTWADAVNSPKAKNTLVRNEYGTSRQCGWLWSEHMMLHNILRQRAFDKGFSPITSKNKLENGAYINYGLYSARNGLADVINRAKKLVIANESGGFLKKKIEPSEWDVDRVKDFLEPFQDTVTIEMLAQIELPEVKMLESSYGKGRKVAKLIIENDVKPTTFTQIDEMLKEVA